MALFCAPRFRAEVQYHAVPDILAVLCRLVRAVAMFAVHKARV